MDPRLNPECPPFEPLRERQPDDILGNQSLIKQTVVEGENDTRPPRQSIASVSYSLFLVDELSRESRLIERVSNESFIVGENDILPAIDIAIQLMDRGEEATLDVDVRHCYGDLGYPEKDIPAVGDSPSSYRMRIEVQFHQWRSPSEISSLSVADRLFWGEKKKQRGNFFFRRRDYSTALQSYRYAVRFLDIDEHPSGLEDDHQSLIDNYIQVKNNLGQVFLLTNQSEQCLESIGDVLRYQPTNVKALFRQGKALFQLGRYEETVETLKRLLSIENDDVEKDKVNEMLKVCRSKVEKYQKNEKEIYRRMFQSKTKKVPVDVSEEKKTKSSSSWWTYVAMGSALLAALGLGAILKSR